MPSRNILDLHPNLQPLCEQFLQDCHDEQLKPLITFTYRTPEEQDRLYLIGRGKGDKRAKVTNLKGDASKHCFMLNGKPASKAFDIMLKDKDGNVIQDGEHPFYKAAGLIGEELGLIWGGRWKSPFDPGHFQLDE